MSFATVPFEYLGWHYTIAITDFWVNTRNLLGFIARFFSLRTLLKTFFSPWRRMGESYKKGFYPNAWLETFILNTLMRLLGIFFRVWLVLVGLISLAIASLLTVLTFCLWLLLPLVVVTLFFSGLTLLFR